LEEGPREEERRRDIEKKVEKEVFKTCQGAGEEGMTRGKGALMFKRDRREEES